MNIEYIHKNEFKSGDVLHNKYAKGSPDWIRDKLVGLIEYCFDLKEDVDYVRAGLGAIACLRLHDLDRKNLYEEYEIPFESKKRLIKIKDK